MTPPPQTPSPRASLTSWKQIAHHLSVSERTAQKWERERGLPVHRLPGPRGRVYAVPVELDAWLCGQGQELRPSGRPVPRWPRPAWTLVTGLCVLALFAVVVAGAVLRKVHQTGPVAWQIKGRDLIAIDAKERVLWRYVPPDGWSIWNQPDSRGRQSPLPVISELPGPGIRSLVFGEVSGQHLERLRCVGPDGSLLWTHVPEGIARVSGQTYEGPWLLRQLAVIPALPGERQRIAVVWQHATHFPSLVQVLDHQGRLERQYWHSGHFLALHVQPGPGFGRPLLYLAGIANGYRQGLLLVLDPQRMTGASREENTRLQILDQDEPVEVARILFPRTRLNQALAPFNSAVRIQQRNEDLAVEVEELFDLSQPHLRAATLFYLLTPDLRLKSLDIGDGVPYFYRRLDGPDRFSPDALAQEITSLPPPRVLTPWQGD
ncbi:MAG: hypothetical protein M9913_11055 [Bryobacteraceae bacterium]|nr:helix-turn-helix domain-containing protein [Solibacteraceae bacterium]MCO5351416.1 hypothetical protein [Bryobacteraceae bacterium]